MHAAGSGNHAGRDARVGIGIVGAGDISRRYVDRRAVLGEPFRSTAELLADPGVDLVVNLTPPLAHADVSAAALHAGKHVYTEKPLAHDLAQADALIELARSQGRVLACAPATHLGPAQQAVRCMLDHGELGDVVGAHATVVYAGPHLWHHNPAALFGAGAGPLLDLGVYFVSAFVHWFGPARRVSAAGRTAHAVRRIHSGPRRGGTFPVTTHTHVAGWIEFHSGVIASLTTSFDSPGSRASSIEVYGTRASLALDTTGDAFNAVLRRCESHGKWDLITPPSNGWADRWWAVGPVDTVDAILSRRTPRASVGVARHVLEVLLALEQSCNSGQTMAVASQCTPPEALPLGPISASFPALLNDLQPPSADMALT
jgi:predicted dehydrogenase